jgi:hypothetical protein
VTDAEDRRLPLGANPEVPAVQQVVDPVFLWRDGEVVRLADDLEMLDVDLMPLGARLSALAVPVTMTGSWERWCGFEHLVADSRLRHDAWMKPLPSQDQKVNLSARATVCSHPLMVTSSPSCFPMFSM